MRRYERISVEHRRFRSNGGRLTQNFRQKGSLPTNHFSSKKIRPNDLSYGIKIWTDLSSLLSQFTRLSDGQTDKQTKFSSLDRVCIPCSALKNWTMLRMWCRHASHFIDEVQLLLAITCSITACCLQWVWRIR